VNTREFLKILCKRSLRQSLWIHPWLSGGCRGCHMEILDAMTPYYDAARLGIRLVSSPRHADAFLVSGALTRGTASGLLEVASSLPGARKVLAVGACACGGGLCFDRKESAGPLDELLPVDFYVPGCPPRPEAILHALAVSLGLLPVKVSRESLIINRNAEEAPAR